MSTNLVWRWAETPVDRETIRRVEDLWGVQLPHDYVHCTMGNHGGRLKPSVFDIPGRPQAVFDHLLDYAETPAQDKDPSIMEVFTAIGERLPGRVFPFAADPFGNFLCFDYRSDDSAPVVVFWDHEVAEPHLAITSICKTFTELLNRLYVLQE